MGRRLALLIATYAHEDAGLRRLTAPEQDAEQLAEVLRDPDIADFDVTMLVNRPSHEVGEAIGDFYRDRRSDDLTLLYFTGHGLKDDAGRLHLATPNTRRDNLSFTSVRAELLDEAMTGCVSRQQVLILDCCYSGAFPSRSLAKGDTDVHTLERFQGRGRTVLTASDATQYSFEGDRLRRREVNQSVFTRHLVQGLRDGSADLDNDGHITLDELYGYVYDRVVEEKPQQRPKRMDNVEGRIRIARNVNWNRSPDLVPTVPEPRAHSRFRELLGVSRGQESAAGPELRPADGPSARDLPHDGDAPPPPATSAEPVTSTEAATPGRSRPLAVTPFTRRRVLQLGAAATASVALLGGDRGIPGGTLKWRLSLGSRGLALSPEVADGVVYISNETRRAPNHVHALDAATGKTRWRQSLPASGPLTSTEPTAADGVVYVNNSSNVHALDATDGRPRWQHPFDKKNWSFAAPVVAGGVVYVSARDDGDHRGHVVALSADTGEQRWDQPGKHSPLGDIPTLIVADGTIYISSSVDKGKSGYDNYVYALDAGTGKQRWEQALDRGFPASTPVVADGVVCVGTTDTVSHHIETLDALTGERHWHRRFPTGFVNLPGPTVTGGLVYVVGVSRREGGGELRALDARTGRQRWKRALASSVKIGTSPVVAGGVVYTGRASLTDQGAAGYVYALDAATGEPCWERPFRTESGVSSSAVVADGLVYVTDEGGHLYAITT